ncbi:hypothetical protein [Flagellimonas sp.]|uniref:hypothetical protein n=1 Tax=Flagellimonas sp. TaxID=2058762 RepID=UPI003B50459C
MSFQTITRDSLEYLNQNLRAPEVLPGALPPARGNEASPQNADFKVSDEFLRILPFVHATEDEQPFARQYQVRTSNDVPEPEFTARPAGTPWTTGKTFAFGQELESVGTRFKKVGAVVRTDELMSGNSADNVLDVQVNLAKVGVLRSLSEAIFHSNPSSDDEAEFSGLPYYLSAVATQDVQYDNTRGMIGGLSELEARVCPGDDGLGTGADIFVMSSRARWRLIKELEDKGLHPDFHFCELTQKNQLHFHGLPVVLGRVPEPGGTGTNLTEAWALKLFGPSGIRILHVGGDYFGVRTDELTTMTQMDTAGEVISSSRGVDVYGIYSLLVPETQSIARLTQIPSQDPFSQP